MARTTFYNAEKGAELLQAKRLVMHRFDLSDAEWTNLMVEIGCRFAESFSRLFPNNKTIQEALLKTKGEDGYRNTYWQWWQFKWMQDDLAYVRSSMYYEEMNYSEIKEAMISEELLETDLLTTIEGKLIF